VQTEPNHDLGKGVRLLCSDDTSCSGGYENTEGWLFLLESQKNYIHGRGESLVLRRVGGRSLPKRGFQTKMMVTERQAPETGHRALRPFSPVFLGLSHFYDSGKKSDTVQTSPLSPVPCPQNFTICLAGNEKGPDMFLLSECKAPEENEKINLGCLVIGSQPLKISWEPKKSSIVEHVFPSEMRNGNYTMVLQVTVLASELNLNHTCTINKPKRKEKPFKFPGEYPWTMQKGLVGLLIPTLS
jgi:hypothetical protein